MKRISSILAIGVFLIALAFGDGPSSKGAVNVAGVAWLNSFEAAQTKALSEGKLILHLQMFGDLDDAYC